MDLLESDCFDFILHKIRKTFRLTQFPHITKSGIWETTKDGHWTGGFWIGLLWWAYKISGNVIFKKNAYKWLNLLEKRKKSRTFDLGFLFYPSFVLGYEFTNDPRLKEVALKAAETLSKTVNKKLEFLYDEKTIDGEIFREIIIDIMPNLSLLWWAYEETGNEEYYNIAYIHSIKMLKELIREDNSTYQGMIFDLNTSEIIKKGTFQGISVDSCWSRGQAWGIYGYASAYKMTKENQFLDVAKNLAMYFISNLPEDYVPYWDFNATKALDTIRDSSAAAIACSGILDIYKYTQDKKFRNYAIKILNSLIKNYLTKKDGDGILAKGCFYKKKNLGVHESLIWGDYYFVEALIKLNQLE